MFADIYVVSSSRLVFVILTCALKKKKINKVGTYTYHWLFNFEYFEFRPRTYYIFNGKWNHKLRLPNLPFPKCEDEERRPHLWSRLPQEWWRMWKGLCSFREFTLMSGLFTSVENLMFWSLFYTIWPYFQALIVWAKRRSKARWTKKEASCGLHSEMSGVAIHWYSRLEAYWEIPTRSLKKSIIHTNIFQMEIHHA